MTRKLQNILVTGGAGFIGSNFIRYLFKRKDYKGTVTNLDCLTYAGNLENLSDIQKEFGGKRYIFKRVNIKDYQAVKQTIEEGKIDTIVHFAAESHVDRSIHGPAEFIRTNIIGTFNLLEIARELWKERDDVLFHHISTDEVYGSLDDTGYFLENTPYDPRSPYSASKASSDHLANAYYHTYEMPVTISNCSNNYGPYQFPEKLIPLFILNMLDEQQLPLYSKGENVRDWLFVDDHNSAVWNIINNGNAGETYNIGGENEWQNIKLVNTLCEKVAKHTGKDPDYYKKLITFVPDRPGHDLRYAINCDKIKSELSWRQSVSFDEGLDITIKWYLDNSQWVENVQSGEYQNWLTRNYGDRQQKD